MQCPRHNLSLFFSLSWDICLICYREEHGIWFIDFASRPVKQTQDIVLCAMRGQFLAWGKNREHLFLSQKCSKGCPLGLEGLEMVWEDSLFPVPEPWHLHNSIFWPSCLRSSVTACISALHWAQREAQILETTRMIIQAGLCFFGFV